MVFVEFNFIYSYLFERKKLQKSKYKKRETVYVFKCKDCDNEVHLRKHDLKKASGYCRKCSDLECAKQRGYRNRKEPFRALFNNFKTNSKRSGKDNNITFEEFLRFVDEKKCYYCHDFVYWAEVNLGKNGNSYNLDRKNNEQGYSLDNCVVCCWKCNESKKDNYTYSEWFEMNRCFRDKRAGGVCGI